MIDPILNYFSSDGHFVLIAEWTHLGSFGKSSIRNICVNLFGFLAKFQEMPLKVFFLFLALVAIWFGEVDQFGQFWWISFNEHLCDMSFNSLPTSDIC